MHAVDSPETTAMRRSTWSRTIFRLGRAWREADYEATDLETVIRDLMTGQYSNPIRIVAFNTAESWSEDVSEDIARELCRRCDLMGANSSLYDL